MTITIIDDITPEYLTEALGQPITALTSEPVGVGVGLIGQLYRVTPTYGDGGSGPKQLIVKLPGQAWLQWVPRVGGLPTGPAACNRAPVPAWPPKTRTGRAPRPRLLREPKMQPIDGQAVGDGAVFAGTARVERIFCDKTGVLRHEPCFGRNQIGVLLCALGDVRLDEESPAGFEHAAHLRQQVRGDHQALGVLLLPPRVGEMHENGARAGRRKARKSRAGVFSQHAGAIPEAAFAQAIVDDGGPFSANFQA